MKWARRDRHFDAYVEQVARHFAYAVPLAPRPSLSDRLISWWRAGRAPAGARSAGS